MLWTVIHSMKNQHRLWGEVQERVEFSSRKSNAQSYFIGCFHIFLLSTRTTKIVRVNKSMIVEQSIKAMILQIRILLE